MAKVPSLVPQVILKQDALPGLRLDAPEGAFGGRSAAAGQVIGKELEQAGDRIFNRAVALQQLDNDAAARDATTEYMLQSGKMYEDYKAKQGKDAPASYQQYQDDLRVSREKIREGLTNPAAQNLYDAQTQSTMARTVLYGASHAAQENKKYQVQSIEARINASGNAAAQHPRDDAAFEIERRNTDRDVQILGGIGGWDEGKLKLELHSADSKLWASRIAALARTEPIAAEQMLTANKAKLTRDDLFRVDQIVRTQSTAIGSTTIAEQVYKEGQGGPDTPPKTVAELQDEAEARAKATFPDNPAVAKSARQAVTGIYNQAKRAQRQENLTNLQEVDAAIVAGGITTENDLLASPRVAAAFQALTPTQQLAVPGKINRYIAARDKVTNEQNYERLWGLSNRDVAAFLDTDLTTQQLSQTKMEELQKRQQKLKERVSEDPRVGRAMGQLRGAMGDQMRAMNVYSVGQGEKNAATYDRFVGALQQALDVWQETNKKPAGYKDVVETIGPELMRKIAEPGWLWGTNEVPRFNLTVPAEWQKKQLEANPGATPEQLRRAFNHQMFKGLYGKKPSQ